MYCNHDCTSVGQQVLLYFVSTVLQHVGHVLSNLFHHTVNSQETSKKRHANTDCMYKASVNHTLTLHLLTRPPRPHLPNLTQTYTHIKKFHIFLLRQFPDTAIYNMADLQSSRFFKPHCSAAHQSRSVSTVVKPSHISC